MKNDNLGDRMKMYEDVNRNYLTRRMPVIIRVDGKAFHSFTRGFDKPFDAVLQNTMVNTAIGLCKGIQNCKLAYTQSDEISLLLVDYENITTEAWFKNNIQKMASVSASMATLLFNSIFSAEQEAFISELSSLYQKRLWRAMFDSRVFNIPENDVCNYFIWRQQDAIRNSIQMVAQANFSPKSLQRLSCDKLQEKLRQEKDINWSTDFTTGQKRGYTIIKGENGWYADDSPILTQDRNYIEKFVFVNKGE